MGDDDKREPYVPLTVRELTGAERDQAAAVFAARRTKLEPFTLHMEIFQRESDPDRLWSVTLRSNYLGSTFPRLFASYEHACTWLALELAKLRPHVALAASLAGKEGDTLT